MFEAREESFQAYTGYNRPSSVTDFMSIWGDQKTKIKGVYLDDPSVDIDPLQWYRNL